MEPRMDAAVAADAKNASTATWKTAHTAVSHSVHTLRQRALHTKFLTLPWRHPVMKPGVLLAVGPYLLDTATRTLTLDAGEVLLGKPHPAFRIPSTAR
jgi:hypothetical protein